MRNEKVWGLLGTLTLLLFQKNDCGSTGTKNIIDMLI